MTRIYRYILQPRSTEPEVQDQDDWNTGQAERHFASVGLAEYHQSEPVEMPVGARIFNAAYTDRGLVVYAYIDPEQELTEYRTFGVAGNGVDLPFDPSDVPFVGTAVYRGCMTAHVFDLTLVPAQV